jgi:hypothetical protein
VDDRTKKRCAYQDCTCLFVERAKCRFLYDIAHCVKLCRSTRLLSESGSQLLSFFLLESCMESSSPRTSKRPSLTNCATVDRGVPLLQSSATKTARLPCACLNHQFANAKLHIRLHSRNLEHRASQMKQAQDEPQIKPQSSFSSNPHHLSNPKPL